jgi:hypothetical protein
MSSKQNESICQRCSAFTANSECQLLFKQSAALCTVGRLSTILSPLKSKISVNINLPAESTPLNFSVLGDDVFPLHALSFAYGFIVVHPRFATRDNQLSLSS